MRRNAPIKPPTGPNKKGIRADHLLVDRGLAASRTQAQALLMSGSVYSAGSRVEKPGLLLSHDAEIEVRSRPRYVSRGGEKLAGALEDLEFEVHGLVAADIGASTGGFCDCLLQHGARCVYAIDVGKGLLDQKLRDDPRVIVMEATNARYLEPSDLPESPDLVTVDASFIGLDKLLPAIVRVLKSDGRLLAMVKPQFEVGREQARKSRGVIRDPAVREEALAAVRGALFAHGFAILGETDARLRGPKGNLERFMLAQR